MFAAGAIRPVLTGLASLRYDAAIIGAGADGLAAAAQLARAGRSTVVIDRAAETGGRLRTREFRPGHFASPYLDSVPELPPELLKTLNVALRPAGPVAGAAREALDKARTVAFAAAGFRRRGWLPDPGRQVHAIAGPGAHAMPRMETVRGGLGSLAKALDTAARTAGAELRLGVPAIDLLVDKNVFGRARARGVLLADGSRVEARAVLSTLDLQQSMFFWRRMPGSLMAQARSFRFAGRVARLLLALDRPVGESAFMLPGDSDAVTAWRDGRLAAQPALLFDPVSVRDPSLAPEGSATATVTVDSVPNRLQDGAWTHARRVAFAAQILARLARHQPALLTALKAVDIIMPTDMEAELGITEGDLEGGRLDQEDGRPGPRTTLRRFYLGGPSTQASRLGTGASGLAAAIAMLAD